VDKTTDKSKVPVIGRSKTVIVVESGAKPIGIVSEIIARVSSDDGADRLAFRGPVNFKARVLQHIHSIILPLLDTITNELGIAKKNYEISVANIGATASIGIGVEITGFSADLPMLLTLLSSALQVAIRQDVVSTGHVASLDGDLAPVRGIPAKIHAVLNSAGVDAFVLADLEKDRSLEILTPNEYKSAKESLLRHKGDIKIHSIGGMDDAIRIFMTDESVVHGSLRAGFFNAKATVMESESPVGRTVTLLAEGNEKRFWDVLGHSLLNRSVDKAKLLIQTYADFHVRNQCYPKGFGEELFRLVISLPPLTRKINDLFPLLSMDSCIKLTQHAKASDHEDVRQLYKAAFGEGLGEISRPVDETRVLKSFEGDRESELFERLLAEISKENLSERVGKGLDDARGSYNLYTVRVKDGFEFNEAITAFYAHMFRHTGSPAGNLDRAALSTEAIDLVEKAFERRGGYKAAVAEGKYGINGGMRLVFDSMTEHLKLQEKGKYIVRVFKDAMDPLDWDAKVRLMEVFRERIGPELSAELRELPAEQLASHWEEIIQCYAESMDKVSELMKRL
jgi:hypothetical protein